MSHPESRSSESNSIESLLESLLDQTTRQAEVSRKRILSKSEAADYLGIAPRTLDKLVSEGEIPVTHLTTRRAFDRRALDQIIRGRTKYESAPAGIPMRRVRR